MNILKHYNELKDTYEKQQIVKQELSGVTNELKRINLRLDNLNERVHWQKEDRQHRESDLDTIRELSMTVTALVNALNNKFDKGLFIYSEDCKMPIVIRDGKELTNNLTTSFSIDWNVGELPNINIEQCAGTTTDLSTKEMLLYRKEV